MVSRPDVPDLAVGALEWLLASAQVTDAGLAWTATRSADELDPTLYSGAAGIVVTLLEAYRHFGEDRFGEAAVRAGRQLAGDIERWEHSSLYFGLTGMAFALQAVHDLLGDSVAGLAAGRALERVSARFDGERWSDQFELLGGNAGIALGALQVGDLELAATAVTPYLDRAEGTPTGVNWEVWVGTPARFHHISHGTLGIVAALAAVGNATGRADLVELALAGAADVVGRNEAGPGGFLVPHSDPQHRPELIERYSYGWCHGPAGDAQVFRLLAAVTGDPAWPALTECCWQTVTTSGLPQRLRPGFWDNSGRCCGTAGVLALACDRHVEAGDDLEFASLLIGDIASRATLDADGARWSHCEHRITPSALEPRTGWAMGNAGIIRELLRFIRASTDRDPAYAVSWPDHPPAEPAGPRRHTALPR
ncbi:MAG: lanthionine synthetase LanC family protein [Mycobacteriales bacterium]